MIATFRHDPFFQFSKNPVMKNILLLVSLMCLPLLMQGQKRAVKNFYHKYKKYEGSRGIMVPGFLIWLGSGVAKQVVKNDDNPEAEIFMKYVKKFKTMRVLVMEEENLVAKEDLKHLIVAAKKGKYEEIISVREGGTHISIMARGKKSKLKNLLILVSSEDEFVMLHAKTKIKVKHINQLLGELMELERVQEKLRKEEKPQEALPPPPAEKKKKDKPIRA